MKVDEVAKKAPDDRMLRDPSAAAALERPGTAAGTVGQAAASMMVMRKGHPYFAVVAGASPAPEDSAPLDRIASVLPAVVAVAAVRRKDQIGSAVTGKGHCFPTIHPPQEGRALRMDLQKGPAALAVACPGQAAGRNPVRTPHCPDCIAADRIRNHRIHHLSSRTQVYSIDPSLPLLGPSILHSI